MKTGLGQEARKVRGLKLLSKQCRSGFAKIRSGNRRSCPESWIYWPHQVVPHQGRSTHESAPPFKGTPPYSCFQGHPMDKSRASPPGARQEWARKHSLHGRENFHHRGAVQQDLCSNVPWGAFWGCREAITLPTSWFGGRCPIMVWHHFCKKGVKLVSECIKRTCYKESWSILTWSSSVVRNGFSSMTQFLPKRPRKFRSGCAGTFWPIKTYENTSSGNQVFPCRLMERQSDMTKLIVAFFAILWTCLKIEISCRPTLLIWQSYKSQVNTSQLTEQKFRYIKDSEWPINGQKC